GKSKKGYYHEGAKTLRKGRRKKKRFKHRGHGGHREFEFRSFSVSSVARLENVCNKNSCVVYTFVV
ncbi:MAG: hypothetical protein COA78_10730, partial [Blastopirellula sp.]